MITPKKIYLYILLLLISVGAYSQTLFWADKEVISEGISFFSTFVSSDDYIYSAWQQVSYFADSEGGVSNLIVRKSSDGYIWEDIDHNIESVEFYGTTPIKNYSIDCDSDGDLIIAYTKGEAGFYSSAEIYAISTDRKSLNRLSIVNYNKAVLYPEIYIRGENGELGYILFTSQLTEVTTEIEKDGIEVQHESGEFSIFASTSSDGINWTNNEEFIKSGSSQSYLPVYKYFNGVEYLLYQTVITQISENNNFQLFLKTKALGETEWSSDRNITEKLNEFVTGYGTESYTEFDNQRPSFTVRDGALGITWERTYGFETSKIYYALLDLVDGQHELIGSEKITSGTRSCSRPKGFQFQDEFYLLWFDNQLGSNDIVMATPDRQTGFWIEKIISDDRNYYSVFGDFLQFKDSLRIYWEDHTVSRDDYKSTRARIQALNPDRDVDSPFVISDYKERDNTSLVRFKWTKPRDSSGIRGFYYSWSRDGEIIYEENVLSNVLISDYLQAKLDGAYVFSVSAEDNAGNVSKLREFTYNFDITPPDRVYFPELRTDERGFLPSNTETIIWDSWDEDVVSFSHRLTFLGTEYDPIEFDINRVLNSNTFTTKQSFSFSNIDDGYYALTVRARDIAGNTGIPEAVIFKLNKYVPITYISYISYSQNSIGELVTTIRGRGFKAGGDVTKVMLDRDGRLPYDYEFTAESGVFDVVTDRRIEGPNLTEIEGGTYRVGIVHPERGTVFSGPVVKVESTGTIKFGDFTQGYEEVWRRIEREGITISFELLIFIISMISAVIITIFTLIKLISINNESKRLLHDAEALANGTPFLKEKDILRLSDMKKRGFGLRLKFTILIIALIVGVITLISLPLANFMIDTQKKNLTDALLQRTEILLNSLATGAPDYFERDDIIGMGNIINTSEAMDDLIWATIVGISRDDNTRTDALWAYTDRKTVGYFLPLPEVISSTDFDSYLTGLRSEEKTLFNEFYSLDRGNYNRIENSDIESELELREIITNAGIEPNFDIGYTPYSDNLSPAILELKGNIQEKAIEEFQDKREELVRVNLEASRATGEERTRLAGVSTILSNQIVDGLKQMSSVTGQVPTVDYQHVEDVDSYIFYKPILNYNPGRDFYYLGEIRLKVSTENINRAITTSIESLIVRVGITAVVAIFIGLVGALLLATLMINPIKRLVAGVQIIRDTENKADLEDHEIIVNSRDELYTLATTVNQMTEGLVKAAAVAQDLTMGKEIQKKFIPLEQDPSNTKIKLTTGEFENKDISVFGYYEGAKGVSGDYFDYRQIDDDHFAMIKCDIAGKGIPASLIMVQVATMFLSYFSSWDKKQNQYKLDDLVSSMNDLLEERAFEGRFAAFIVVILNVRNGKCYMCNAGDNLVNIYRHKEQKMETMVLNEIPAAGIFSSDMLDMQGGYQVETTTLHRGDILFLFTDGVEEAKHLFRDENYNEIVCEHKEPDEEGRHDTHAVGEPFEELGPERIVDIIHAVMHKSTYNLKKYHYPQPEATFTFDFTNIDVDVKEAVLGLIAVEKIFRINPDPSSTQEDVIKIDKVVNKFLLQTFKEYSDYFKFKVDKGENAQHDFFSNIKEDDQYDDLTILAVKRK